VQPQRQSEGVKTFDAPAAPATRFKFPTAEAHCLGDEAQQRGPDAAVVPLLAIGCHRSTRRGRLAGRHFDWPSQRQNPAYPLSQHTQHPKTQNHTTLTTSLHFARLLRHLPPLRARLQPCRASSHHLLQRQGGKHQGPVSPAIFAPQASLTLHTHAVQH
jgi:hypothetical protein